MDLVNISKEHTILYVVQNLENKEIVLQILAMYPEKIIKTVETLLEYASPNFQKVRNLIVVIAESFPGFALDIVKSVIGRIPHRETSQEYVYGIFQSISDDDYAIKIAEIAIKKNICYPQNLVLRRPTLAVCIASLSCCTPSDISAIMRMNSDQFKGLKIS